MKNPTNTNALEVKTVVVTAEELARKIAIVFGVLGASVLSFIA